MSIMATEGEDQLFMNRLWKSGNLLHPRLKEMPSRMIASSLYPGHDTDSVIKTLSMLNK